MNLSTIHISRAFLLLLWSGQDTGRGLSTLSALFSMVHEADMLPTPHELANAKCVASCLLLVDSAHCAV